MDEVEETPLVTPRKPSIPINPGLRGYLLRYKRERQLPVTYDRLRDFQEVIPLVDSDGRPTLCVVVVKDTHSEEIFGLVEDITDCYWTRQAKQQKTASKSS